LLQFFYHYDVPHVRRNNRKIARLQYEAFYLSMDKSQFLRVCKTMETVQGKRLSAPAARRRQNILWL
jgi:hypothetical protein